MYDIERIAKIISDIERYLAEMQELGIRTPADLADRKNYHSLSMVMFTIINKTIDLGSEMVLANKLGVPSTYSEIFELLSRKKIITDKLRSELSKLVRYRNRISHEYFDLKEMELFSLCNEIGVVNEFVTVVKSLLTKI